MDETVLDIEFNSEGVCNVCLEYRKKLPLRLASKIERDSLLNKIIKKIKKRGKNSEYDCLIGVSGGVDSTYLAYKVKELGLRPLAFHFDNGWNSRLGVTNIEKVLRKLDIDLYTYVVDWEEFKDIQYSFLKASTPDGEIPTDHAILSTMYQIANKFKIKYIISGNNYAYEGLLPKSWAYGHIDWKYIKNVHNIFGSVKLKTFPHITLLEIIYLTYLKGIKLVSLLNYIDYDKREALKIIENKLDWEPYGWKHHESIYTRFYQAYVLINKFDIDKRKAHLSTQICSGKTTRDDALKELKNSAYGGHKLKEDMEFVIKKFGLTKTTFDKIMRLSNKSFKDYKNSFWFHNYIRSTINYLRGKQLLHK